MIRVTGKDYASNRPGVYPAGNGVVAVSRTVLVDRKEVKLTNLDKALWLEGLTKADLIAYYHEAAPYILPHIADRPAVLHRYPDGIDGESFYQKQCPAHAPDWVRTVAVGHNGGRKIVNYIVHRDRATLVWTANQAAIELHTWLSRADRLQYPDLAVIDLDPAAGASFEQVVTVALLARQALREYDLDGLPKTSGATGIHIYIPLEPRYTFSETAAAIRAVARMVTGVCPFATTERAASRRAGKVYMDYLQNGFGRTMAAAYSVRPLPGAPVSMPLTWEQLAGPGWRPGDFNLRTVLPVLASRGDVFDGLFKTRYTLDKLLKAAVIWKYK